MRRLIALLGLLLALPATAKAAGSVTAFYYPWYGTPSIDGGYEHWSQSGHAPPNDIASAYYPARGLYSSSDLLVLGEQMDEIKAAGIDQIAVSWWGRGSPEDERLPEIITAAANVGVKVAIHLEPYAGRTVESTVGDVAYLRGYGLRTFYLYEPLDQPALAWAAAQPELHADGTVLFAQTPLAGWAAAAGFDGVYTYDIVIYRGDMFRRLCLEAHTMHLLCAPSVGPGFNARRATGDPVVKPRKNGATYDAMWRAAISSGADAVTITSYNEWHEGTQIEPAALPGRHGRYRYASYDGAWGLHGASAQEAYLVRTAYWAVRFRSTSALHEKISAS